jgi:hypothetical protein
MMKMGCVLQMLRRYDTIGLKFNSLFWESSNSTKKIFFGKLTYVLKEEDTNIIRGIPQIYNDNRNINTTDGYRLATDPKTETSLDS